MPGLGTITANAFSKVAQEEIKEDSHNLANTQTNGFLEGITYRTENAVNGKGTGVSSTTLLEADSAQSLTATSKKGDIAVLGPGMLVVSANQKGEKLYYKKTGSFDTNAESYLVSSDSFLQGYAYKEDGTFSKDALSSIKINKEAVSEGQATKNLSAFLKLDADTVATGNSGILLRGIEAPGTSALKNSNIVVSKTEKSDIKGTQAEGSSLLMQYGGFVETGPIVATAALGVGVVANDNLITVRVLENGVQRVVDIQYAGGAADYGALLAQLKDQLNAHGSNSFGAEVRKNTATNTVSLVIYSKKNNLQISCDALPALGLAFDNGSVISPVNENTNRFANVAQLKNLLEKNGYTVSAIGTQDIYLHSQVKEMLSVSNQDKRKNVLQLFGVNPDHEGEVLAVYSYVDSNHNMAGGNINPDYQERIPVYDAKGGKQDLRLAAKKISQTQWIVELFAPGKLDNGDADTYRADGLLQAGILNFDSSGKLQGVSAAKASRISESAMQTPQAALGATDGDQVLINGVAFTYRAAPAAGEFNSLYSLIDRINADPNTDCIATLGPSGGGYNLVLTPKTKNSITIESNPPAATSFNSLMSLLGLKTDTQLAVNQNNNIPLLGSVLNIKWQTVTTRIAPSAINFTLDQNETKEFKGIANVMQSTGDGFAFGIYNGWYIGEGGDVTLKFTNGAPDKKIAKIPVAVFKAPQYLKREHGGYTANAKTGEAAMRLSGEFAGDIKSEVVAESSADSSSVLMRILEDQHYGQLNITAMTQAHKLEETFVNKI